MSSDRLNLYSEGSCLSHEGRWKGRAGALDWPMHTPGARGPRFHVGWGPWGRTAVWCRGHGRRALTAEGQRQTPYRSQAIL